MIRRHARADFKEYAETRGATGAGPGPAGVGEQGSDERSAQGQRHDKFIRAARAGAVVAVLCGAVARRGAFTLGPLDLQIDWADRVVITGANDSGKTILRLRHTYGAIRVLAAARSQLLSGRAAGP